MSHDEDVRRVRYALGATFWYPNDHAALDRILARYDALVQEHEAWAEHKAKHAPHFIVGVSTAHTEAHDNAERLMNR